jgi:ABC-type transport system involved in cytochrome bd biosynthesis fused ATPase/permease subunit
MDLAQQVRQLRRESDMEAGRAQEVARAGLQAEQDVAALKEELARHERIAALLTTVGEQRQESAQRQIEELVTRGLQAIFDESLSFHMVPSVRNSQAQVDFVIRSVYLLQDDDQPVDAPLVVETPVLEARGGGMAVVVAFALRLVMLLLTPGTRRLLVLDESFAHVSREYEPRVAEFIRQVCDYGVQVVMVTHSDAYSDLADARYRLELGPGGVTQVTEA